MTDLISGPDTGAIASSEPTEVLPPSDDRPVEWALTEAAPRKRRLGLWIGLGAGVVVLAAAAASLILIAPGTTIAGVAVGGMTPGMAADAISTRIATTQVALSGAGDGAELSGTDLGASVDAKALAEKAFADRPMWNLGAWMGSSIDAKVTLDPETAESALRAAVPDSYTDAVDAGVSFDAASATYTSTPATAGSGIPVPELEKAFTSAIEKGATKLTFSGDAKPVDPAITDAKAAAATEKLNGMLASIGFYVGEERTVPVAPDVAASWLKIADVDGELKITADPSAIQTVVATLPGLVDRPAVNAVNVIDSKGKVLSEVTAGLDGRSLGDTAGIASAFATQLGDGKAAFALPVNSTPFETTTVFRRLEVDISEQKTYLYENEKLVQTWKISSGLAGTPTPLGRFKVFAHTAKQDMGCFEGASYCTKDVPWNTWFAKDIAFHGAYWHNNFGHRMSHGCVNMPPSVAKQVYDMTPNGLEVWVHA